MSEADRVVEPGELTGDAVALEDEKRRALDAGLDTLEALVLTLEQIQDPIQAWNGAAEAARLLRALERDREAFALGLSEDDAARQYPAEIDRLKTLEAKRDVELNRILNDPLIAQVLIEEMNKAEAGN